MILIGITGGLASGKSTVAGLFQECGAFVIQADQLARTVVAPGKTAWKEIVQTFGSRVLQADRTLDRSTLAQLVFHNPRKLSVLNRIVHPRVAREQVRQTNAITRQHPHAVIIYDAALLIEARAHERMDRIIVVTATQPIQVQRARQRDGTYEKRGIGPDSRATALAHQTSIRGLCSERYIAGYPAPTAGTTTVSGVSSRSGFAEATKPAASRVTIFHFSHEE